VFKISTFAPKFSQNRGFKTTNSVFLKYVQRSRTFSDRLKFRMAAALPHHHTYATMLVSVTTIDRPSAGTGSLE